MRDRFKHRQAAHGRQTAIACAASVCAGGATRWLTDAPVLILTLITAVAILLVLATPRASVSVVIAGSILAAAAVQLPTLRVEPIFQGVLYGLLTTMALAGPLTIRRAIRQQREFQRRGWQLAAIESQRRASEIRAAVQRERMTLAAEMHDGLGHSLTLIAVRLGQLSLTSSLSEDDRAEVAGIREIAADAADNLGLAVRLLRESDTPAAGWGPPTIEDAIEGARRAGIHVDAQVDHALTEKASEGSANAAARLVQEGLTNAAKHAPGEPVTIRIEIHDGTVTARISNPKPERKAEATVPGFGLAGLRHRAKMLGGHLSIDNTATVYSVTLTVPLQARPSVDSTTDDLGIVDAENQAATLRTKANQTAIVLPVALASALLFVAAGYFVLANTLSVLSPSQFADIAVGDDRAMIEQELPALEMLDAPRADFPARPHEECRYFEAEISFFERVDVYVVCFTSDQVSRTGTVPAP